MCYNEHPPFYVITCRDCLHEIDDIVKRKEQAERADELRRLFGPVLTSLEDRISKLEFDAQTPRS